MNYLLDKKLKRKKFFKIALGIIILIILFYFRINIFNSFSFIVQKIFRPVLVSGNSIGEKFKNLQAYFSSKNSLYLQNQTLQSQLNEEELRIANYNSIVAENSNLKEILGRKNENITMVLAAILSKPNRSPYDTILIDAGVEQGIKIGDIVFALGDVPIGRIAEISDNSSKVILFSNNDEKTQAIITGKPASPSQGGDIFLELVGRGGGNFEIILPRDFVLQKGDQVLMLGLNPYVLAIVETIISDPREPFTKALLVSPVNIQELKFVGIGQ